MVKVSAVNAPIVLAADAGLTAAFPLLFDGMLAASQTTTTPGLVLDLMMLPRHRGPGYPAFTAPLGLRRIEAALFRAGFSATDIAVSDDRGLSLALGPATRVIGIACGDPLGRGMNSTTMSAVAGGRPWPTVLFQRMLEKAKRFAPQASMVVGGPGAWQLATDEAARKRLGIDHVVTGYAEAGIAATLRDLLAGATLPPVITGQPPMTADIPTLRGAATFGAVELSRGCGWGCGFCTLAHTPMQHLSMDQVLADVAVNQAAGLRQAALLSEDAFRYGGAGREVQPAALLALVEAVRRQLGDGPIQLDHANVASVARWSDADLATLYRLLSGDGSTPVWLNLGVESSDGRLLAANGGAPKMGGVAPDEWGTTCAQQAKRLAKIGFVPFLSLVMGLPGETPEHIAADQRWIENLADLPIAVFPMALAPLEKPWQGPHLRRAHWRLMQTAYRRNFRWVPWLYERQCRAAGIPLRRRLLIQCLGLGQVWQWRMLFAWRKWRASP